MTGYDVEAVRKDFPILARTLAGDRPLVYLDSANTSQKPRQVVEAIERHYLEHNANVARAMHQLGAEASAAFELGRDKVAEFIGAPSRDEVIFTKNASEALNLVARVLGDSGRIGAGDEVVVTQMEHHSNLVPWQMLSQRVGADLRWYGVTPEGRLDLDSHTLTERTKVVAVTWVSNMLGTINPVAEIVRRAREVGALVVIDASQAVPQLPVDVAELGADFVAFTGHKMVGPTGIGVLWGRYDLLAELPPFLGGGEMIETVSMEATTFAAPPHRFEAGTPPIAQSVGLGAAVDYLTALGMENVAAHEQQITAYALEAMNELSGVTIVGPKDPVDRGGAISFTVDGVHPHDVSQLLDSQGVAVRAGHHCAKPLHQHFGVQSTTRASFYLYTTEAEIDALVAGIRHTQSYFGA
ncbi:cysteine desulfurase [Aeromicrobium sp.]|uniref:cysteine desulfurase n=1 Tax=Aeromicrobium sp. TaxID=1871063 RepID=UPI0028ADEB3A|nr:cysteine desulfurase [Aeromicrobium sp.]